MFLKDVRGISAFMSGWHMTSHRLGNVSAFGAAWIRTPDKSCRPLNPVSGTLVGGSLLNVCACLRGAVGKDLIARSVLFSSRWEDVQLF